jgi:D-alanyl-D-alanine carboxypeptidase (penicillin-binding protein 5/6)
MKKNRVLSFIFTLALAAGLLAPFSAVSATSVDQYHVNAKAAILVDTAHGEILYEQNAHEKLYPASITKVMTALLVIEAVESGELTLDQPITASSIVNDRMIAGASTQDIKAGEIMPLRDVLACALIPSANEACNILAETLSGSLTAFVERMNSRAAKLGCENTNFVNPHGLHDSNHYTTAWDIYLISNEAMKYPLFREMVTSKNYTVAATNMTKERTLHDTNALISNFNRTGYLYEYATGIKTGYTPEAGYCLASAATKGDRSLIAVVLGCERTPGTTGSQGFTYFTESKNLLEFGFNNFSRRTIIDGTDPLLTLPVTLSEEADQVVAEPNGSIEATLPNDLDVKDFSFDAVPLQESVVAPVEKGQVLGKVTVSYQDKVYGTLDLVAVAHVERSELLYRLDQIDRFFSQLWVKIALLALILLVLVLVFRFLVFGKRSGSSKRRRSGYGGRRR